MYKLVILDLDGTLLTIDKKISDYTLEVIKKVKTSAKIVLASARGFFAIKKYLEELELLKEGEYTIAFNGSLVVDNSGTIIINNYIKDINILEEYIEALNHLDWYYYTSSQIVKRSEIADINEFLINENIYKVVCVSSEKEIKTIRESISTEILNTFQITSSELNRIDFVDKGMTKINAIKKLLSILDINQSEVIAIGDGENDIDMIKFAGCGVAMENATDEVKKAADIITDTNNNDGVAKVLEKLFYN